MAKKGPRVVSKTYPNQGIPWTGAEKNLIMISEKTDKELSEVIGRTVSAICNQRHLMYKSNIEKEQEGQMSD